MGGTAPRRLGAYIHGGRMVGATASEGYKACWDRSQTPVLSGPQSKLNRCKMSTSSVVHLYDISVGSSVALVDPVTTGDIVTFRSTDVNLNVNPGTGNSVNNSVLNLLAENGAFLLTIGFRIGQNPDGPWLVEQRVSNVADQFTGRTGKASVTVFDHGDKYQVVINEKTVIQYTKQISGPTKSLSYEAPGNASIFSPEVEAKTYTSLAAPQPNLG
ncbi:unnamed protein product [Cyclocybe aegerita]|uniref:Galectin domain-containing protein n=1 Tax=Cyclocybe aegerita TaxID=1973307 RepID=A0A8S0VRQ1_CYCAE|nr:unnamed protein product [Cyclocybe aegerita]